MALLVRVEVSGRDAHAKIEYVSIYIHISYYIILYYIILYFIILYYIIYICGYTHTTFDFMMFLFFFHHKGEPHQEAGDVFMLHIARLLSGSWSRKKIGFKRQ